MNSYLDYPVCNRGAKHLQCQGPDTTTWTTDTCRPARAQTSDSYAPDGRLVAHDVCAPPDPEPPPAPPDHTSTWTLQFLHAGQLHVRVALWSSDTTQYGPGSRAGPELHPCAGFLPSETKHGPLTPGDSCGARGGQRAGHYLHFGNGEQRQQGIYRQCLHKVTAPRARRRIWSMWRKTSKNIRLDEGEEESSLKTGLFIPGLIKN